MPILPHPGKTARTTTVKGKNFLKKVDAVSMKSRSLVVIGILAVLGLTVIGYSVFKPSKQDAEGFYAETLGPDSGRVSLKSLCAASHGKYTYLNFWATWCPVCRQDMPVLVGLARKHVHVVFVASDTNKELVRQYVEDRRYGTLDFFQDKTGDLMKHFSVKGLPTTIKLDGNCQEISRHVGPIDVGTVALFFDVNLKDVGD